MTMVVVIENLLKSRENLGSKYDLFLIYIYI
jgi:hypothetical protein